MLFVKYEDEDLFVDTILIEGDVPQNCHLIAYDMQYDSDRGTAYIDTRKVKTAQLVNFLMYATQDYHDIRILKPYGAVPIDEIYTMDIKGEKVLLYRRHQYNDGMQ